MKKTKILKSKLKKKKNSYKIKPIESFYKEHGLNKVAENKSSIIDVYGFNPFFQSYLLKL